MVRYWASRYQPKPLKKPPSPFSFQMAETDEARPDRVASIVHSNTSSGTVMAVCDAKIGQFP